MAFSRLEKRREEIEETSLKEKSGMFQSSDHVEEIDLAPSDAESHHLQGQPNQRKNLSDEFRLRGRISATLKV